MGGNLLFKTRINVYGKVSEEKENNSPRMMDFGGSYNGDYGVDPRGAYYDGIYKRDTTSIVTKADVLVPNTAIPVENGKGNYWDISEAGNNSVIAYVEETGVTTDSVYNPTTGSYEEKQVSTYKLTIGGNGRVLANPNCSLLFFAFSNLQSIDLRNLDTSEVTNMTYMFGGCDNIATLDMGSFDTSNVTDMSYMFWECYNLTSLNISSFNTSSVTTMSYMFEKCNSLSTLDLSHFDTSKVTNMSGMFSECNSLTNVDVSHFNTSKVKSMGRMFYNCVRLVDIDLLSFDTSEVTNMWSMFYNCSNLTSINVSNLWTIENAYIVDMFKGCGTDHVTVV